MILSELICRVRLCYLAFFFVLLSTFDLPGQNKTDVIIKDQYHYSHVFGANRSYRIFLPPEYDIDTDKKYPVIYFFHGWAQRYFGSMGSGYSDYDVGEENNGDNIEKFVSNNDVIVVKVDGLNQFTHEPLNLTPYNISKVTSFRQFPEYFLELVRYIDGHYKTLKDRRCRAVSGLSMGGFMTFWMAAKFPDLVSAAGNFCGSTEFQAGPLEFPVVYMHSEMYDNFKSVSVRMHNGTRDRLRFYHNDFNRYWQSAVPHYQYKMYEASHITCGLGEMFEFIMNAFENPLPVREQWDYIDIYPSFNVWGYSVESSRNQSGFTILERVSKTGFRSSVRNFLPDGELMTHVSVKVKTAPFYEAETEYQIRDVDVRTMESRVYLVESDSEGVLEIETTGSIHEIYIGKPLSDPEIVVSSWSILEGNWAIAGDTVNVSIKALNKGFSQTDSVSVELYPISDDIVVIHSSRMVGELRLGVEKAVDGVFQIKSNNLHSEIGKLGVLFKDSKGNTWNDELDIRFKEPVDEILDFEIGDGKELTVVKAAVDSTYQLVGIGNGDGIPNPGETIEILVEEEGKLIRTFAYSISPYLNQNNTNIRIADSWQEYDHIGGAFKYSKTVLSNSIPEGQNIPIYIEYWLPGKLSGQHIVKRGYVNIEITGKDITPPQVQWLQVLNEESIEIKAYDGGSVERMRINLEPNPGKANIKHVNWESEPESISFEVYDNGENKDLIKDDGIFTKLLKGLPSYFYDVSIELWDNNGNFDKMPQVQTIYLKDTRKLYNDH
ncbi:alpha/beta hydrolase [Membranihabitans maritimus]|uniref:alpha/beta hydrolase n=1 Tax=Membranihabitans maritimus TaxID=2904244 RepID=UPI001F369AF6|nr:alpha/beta hydrolase-fold protein [Membranihabitans maritimus]